MHVKIRRPSAGTVLGTVALVFALTGAAVALPGSNSVNSGDIKNGQVKTADLSKKAVAPKVKVQSATRDQFANIPADTTVEFISKTVPQGRYAVTAKANVTTTGDDSISCDIVVGATTQVDTATINPDTAATTQTHPIAMLGVATVPAGQPLRVECAAASDNGSAAGVQLVAIPVK